MKQEDLSEALNYVDEKTLYEVEAARNGFHPKKTYNASKWIAIAAGLILVIGAGALFMRKEYINQEQALTAQTENVESGETERSDFDNESMFQQEKDALTTGTAGSADAQMEMTLENYEEAGEIKWHEAEICVNTEEGILTEKTYSGEELFEEVRKMLFGEDVTVIKKDQAIAQEDVRAGCLFYVVFRNQTENVKTEVYVMDREQVICGEIAYEIDPAMDLTWLEKLR